MTSSCSSDDLDAPKLARPQPHVPSPIGYALWHLEESRDWTLEYVDGISQRALDIKPAGHRHSVATLLYHIAVFEVDWVYTDVLGNEYDMERLIPGCPPAIADLLPYPMLLENHTYTPVSGEPLSTHLDRLVLIRQHLMEVFAAMSIEEFRTLKAGGDTQVTPEWVLMHLARHESEHRGQIWEARVAVDEGDPGRTPSH